MKKLNLRLSQALLAGFFVLSVPQKVFAQCSDTGNTIGEGIDCAGGNLPKELSGSGGIITNVINVLLSVIGVVAVIVIIYAAFSIVLSAGNEKAVADAKNTILYAIAGLIIAVLAFAIVNFVVGRI